MKVPLASEESNKEIQYEKSSGIKNKKPTGLAARTIEISFVLSVLFSILCEYLFSRGASALFIGGMISLLFEFSARKHDNIPVVSLFYPIIGNYYFMIKYLDNFYEQTYNEVINYSNKHNNGKIIPMIAACLPKRTIVLVTDPIVADIIFRKQFGNAIKEKVQYDAIRPLLGHGIFSSNGAVWKKHRAIASRMFTTRSLRDYMFKNFMETTDKLLIKIDELMSNNDNINMYDMFLRLTFEAFTNTAFGIDVNAISVAPDVVPFANAFDRSLAIIGMRFTDVPFIWKTKEFFQYGYEKELTKHSKLMEAFIKDVISKRKEFFATIDNELKNSSNSNERMQLRKKYDLLSLFIKDNPNISDKELRDITMNFIIAGRDTTAQTLTWFMYELTRKDNNGNKVNIEVENKIREEITNVLKKNSESGIGDDISYNTINELKYLEASFLETLRLHPSVPHLVRTAVNDFNFGEITGDYENYNYTIRKDDEVLIAAWVMGRLNSIWDKPFIFNPNRFIDSKTNKIIDYSGSKYPAFNLNPRMCLGKNVALLEAKIAIVKLFTKYKNITINPDNQEIKSIMAATNHLKNGLKISLK